ncbi:protein tramtrack, beta isoform-like isoform X1 [Portunus trituberculatus]|uniref:protein tramtrack, beta isoform-like isoform X1 n=2 Tax=Portunus trituberculatus TaxID=210409 RepID=UPI001E1CEBA7|nr:protein tramtrack, beta isoform-like isoform X1 [Portunus trituberculatus]
MKYVMSEEEFLLKWNNHQTNFVDVFNELLQDESFVDVTLVCGGEAVPGHKMVLAACSPLLHRILRDNPCRHPLVILGDVPAGDMRAIMHFIYQGEVSVSQSELASFLKTADNLQIKGLAENRESSGKEDRKRKDKDGERLEGRPNNKRQRTSEGRLDNVNTTAAPAMSPVSSRSHKSLSDSHSSSHKGRGGGNRATGDEQHHQQGLRNSSGGRSSATNSTTNHHHNHHPATKHHTPSSRHSSSKASHTQDIPSKVSSSSSKHRGEEGVSTSHHHHHHNSENSAGDDKMMTKEELDELTVKTEPLDYPVEVAWSEGALGREAGMEDSQGLLPAISASMAGGLEGVAAAIVASPNLPIIEFGDDSRNDDGSRGDLSTASDDVNVNNTAGTQVQDRHTQGSAGVPGAVVRSTLGHPPLQMQKQPHPHHPHHNQHDSPPHSKIQPGGGAQSFPGLHSVPLPIPSCTPGSLASPIPPPSSSALSLITTITNSTTTSTGSSSGGHNNNNVHKCQQCPFITSNPYTFTRHLRIHLGTKEFRCRLCGFATSRKDSLIRHFRMKHLTGEMSVYHDLDSRDIEELAMARVIPEGLQIFAGKLQ